MGKLGSSIIQTSYFKRGAKGYDLDLLVERARDAPYTTKKVSYRTFCLTWGLKVKRKPWKRVKIFTRSEYLTLLLAIVPGLWFYQFNKLIVSWGAVHVLQVIFLSGIITAPLIYGSTFFADYMKTPSTTFWRVRNFTHCFLPMQIIGVVMESLQGCGRSMLFLSHFFDCFLAQHKWRECPNTRMQEYVCYDHAVHSLSQRCQSGDLWVVCPDNMSFILPTHHFFIEDCHIIGSYSIWQMLSMVIHWVIVACVSLKGLRSFISEIIWSLLALVVIHILCLIGMLFECGTPALVGIKTFVEIDLRPLLNILSWKEAFVVTMDLATWSLPSNTFVAAGLLFRTSRWSDTTMLLAVSIVAALFFSATNYTIIGCLARKLHTTIKTIWKPKNVYPGDVILSYYFKDYALGPIFIAFHHLGMFVLHIWPMAALSEAFILSICESCDLLDWQSTLLLVFVAVCLPLSVYSLQFSACDITHDSQLTRAITTLRLLNGMVLSIVVFWLYGVKNLRDDHHFMYGSEPLGAIWKMWKVMPFIFIVMTVVDLIYGYRDHGIRCASNVVLAIFLAVSFLSFLVLVWLQVFKRKGSLSYLFQPSPRLGPPNVKLRAARALFEPHVGRGMLPWTRIEALDNIRRGAPKDDDRPSVKFAREAENFRRHMEARPVLGPAPEPLSVDRAAFVAARTRRYAEDVSFFTLMGQHGPK